MSDVPVVFGLRVPVESVTDLLEHHGYDLQPGGRLSCGSRFCVELVTSQQDVLSATAVVFLLGEALSLQAQNFLLAFVEVLDPRIRSWLVARLYDVGPVDGAWERQYADVRATFVYCAEPGAERVMLHVAPAWMRTQSFSVFPGRPPENGL